MEEVNVEWPKRLARLVEEKGDGTRLLQLTHLNCPQPDSREVSKILKQNVCETRSFLSIGSVV